MWTCTAPNRTTFQHIYQKSCCPGRPRGKDADGCYLPPSTRDSAVKDEIRAFAAVAYGVSSSEQHLFSSNKAGISKIFSHII
eukprot:bmy_20400T0